MKASGLKRKHFQTRLRGESITNIVGGETGQFRRGRTGGHQFSIGEINIRGFNDACERILVEEWAQKHELDIVCVAETKHSHTSIEGEHAGYIEDEKVR